MEIIGYVSAVLIGLSLGLMGSGGSILTVPVLVYFFALDAITATAYSLFIVGLASGTGAFQFIKKKEVDIKVAIIFAIPSLIAVYSVRRYLMPILPDMMFSIGEVAISKDTFILSFFAIIMLVAGLKMIIPKKEQETKEVKNKRYGLIVLEGLVVGAITGFVGAGGGFLIVPALVLLVGIPMKQAVPTSLMIIAVKSLIGFTGDIQNLEIDWPLLLTISVIAVGGIFLGMYLGRGIDGKKLKSYFGIFVIGMAIFMLIKETGII